MRAARGVLVGLGIVMLGLGAWAFVAQVEPRAYIGLLLWCIAALVLHDGVIAPLTVLVGVLARRAGRRVPYASIAVAQTALLIVALLCALVIPEIVGQHRGTANPTILPLDYAAHLAIVVGVLLVLAVAITVVPLVRRRR